MGGGQIKHGNNENHNFENIESWKYKGKILLKIKNFQNEEIDMAVYSLKGCIYI